MAAKTQTYAENGLVLSKIPLYVGDEVTITYDGLLARCGADKVYAYIGYGDEWEEKGFIPMTYEFDVFKATFKVIMPGSLNLAFKDSAENWDNNSNENYTFKVSKRQKTAAKAEGEEKPAKTAAKTKTVKTTAKSTAKTTTKSATKAAGTVKTATAAKTTRKKKEETKGE